MDIDFITKLILQLRELRLREVRYVIPGCLINGRKCDSTLMPLIQQLNKFQIKGWVPQTARNLIIREHSFRANCSPE